MSLQRSNKKEFQRSDYDHNQLRVKASLTQQGFYRKNNNNAGMNLSNLSQKQSIYDHKYNAHIGQSTSQFGYSTLNPSKYPIPSTLPHKQEEYQIIVEFQLKRQREKNRILEQRLKNKQIFISQMKDVQNELTNAFQKCQEELQFYKKKSSQPSIEAREYLEEINQLKHLVIRLQDKITEYEKKQNKRYSSVKQQNTNEDNKKSITKFQQEGSGRMSKVKEKRSKTLMNQHDSSPQFKKFDIIQEYVQKYPARIASFISQFLAMVEWFSEDAQNAKRGQDKSNIKRRLKIGWKWIKQKVGEWNNYKIYTEKLQNFHKKLRKICKIPQSKDQLQSLQLILSALRE